MAHFLRIIVKIKKVTVHMRKFGVCQTRIGYSSFVSVRKRFQFWPTPNLRCLYLLLISTYLPTYLPTVDIYLRIIDIYLTVT